MCIFFTLPVFAAVYVFHGRNIHKEVTLPVMCRKIAALGNSSERKTFYADPFCTY